MKKAVIQLGSNQYLVSEGSELDVDLMSSKSELSVPALLVVDDNKTTVGRPATDVKVSLKVLAEVKADKVTAIRYKAKKRVSKVRGHRQKLSSIKVTKIA